MESLGEYLQRVRKEREMSFEDVVARTKINPVYVKALEEDNLGGLPNAVFAKGFLRAYLQILLINEKAVLERYGADIQDYFSVPIENPILPRTLTWKERTLKQFSFIHLNGYGGLLIIVLLLSFFTVFKIQGGFLNSPPAPQGGSSPESTPISNVESSFINSSYTKSILREAVLINHDSEILQVTREAKTEKISESIADSSLDQASGEQPHSLFIEALEQSWILVLLDDNKVPREIILEAGEEFTFYAKEKFLVTLGNAGGVYISLDGETQGPFGKSGQVVRDILLMVQEKKLLP